VVCTPAPAWSGKYFIINFYGDVHKDTHDGVALSEFILYGEDGNRVNQGAYSYTPLPAAETQQYGNFGGIDDATQLAQCEVAVWMPNHDGFIGPDSASSPPYLFDGKLSTGFRFTWFWESSNKFVFRLTNSAPEVVGFSFVTDGHPERRPTQWKLWGSDDGVAWTALANNATNTGNEATWTWLTNSTPDTVRTEYAIYPLDRLASSSAYAPFGDAEVSVGSGATNAALVIEVVELILLVVVNRVSVHVVQVLVLALVKIERVVVALLSIRLLRAIRVRRSIGLLLVLVRLLAVVGL
jgi:hypothetical protein